MDVSDCEPCDARFKQKVSVKYCMECEERLCIKCTENHKVQKVSRHHHLVDIDKIPHKLDVPSSCQEHPNIQFEYFCIDHDTLCCKECLAESHRTCVKVVSIDAASLHAKGSQSYTDYAQEISHLLESLTVLGDKRKENITNLDSDAGDIKLKIENVKQSIIKQMDLLEESLVAELTQLKLKEELKIKEDVKAIDNIMRETREHQSAFDFINNHGTEKQAFLLVHSSKQLLHNIEDKVKRLAKHTMHIKLSFRDKEILKSMTAIGSIEITKNPDTVSFVTTKQRQSQIPVDIDRQVTSFTFQNDVNLKQTYPVNIIGMTVTDNNLLLLCAVSSGQILILDESDTYKSSIDLKYKPWDVATIPYTATAVVTSRYDPYLQLIDVNKQTTLRTIYIPGSDACGVGTTKEKILVGGKCDILILDNQGNTLRMIHPKPNQCDTIWYMTVGSNDKIYFTDSNGLYCTTIDGNEVFTYTSPELLQPRKVALDKQGNVYVVGCTSQNIHKLSPEGKYISTILSAQDGLMTPYAICFNNGCTKMYVTKGGKTVSVYN